MSGRSRSNSSAVAEPGGPEITEGPVNSPLRRWSEGIGVFLILLLALVGPIIPHQTSAGEWTGSLFPVWLWSALALLPLLALHERVDTWFAENRIGSALVIAVICAAATWVALGDDLDARLGAIDDHEIVQVLGPGHSHLKWKDWRGHFVGSEAGSFGSLGRYRPAFYAVRLAECCLWGKEAPQWYATHLVLCGLMLAFLWGVTQRWWGASLGFAFAMVVLGLPPLGDIYARLAASEAYAMPAFALGLWAWTAAYAKGPSAWGLWWLGTLGFAFAELNKENFVPLGALAVMLAALVLWRSEGSRKLNAWLAVGALALITLAMLGIMARMTLITGKDYYGNEIQASGTLHSALHSTGRLFLALSPLMGWMLIATRGAKAKSFWGDRKALLRIGFLLAVAVVAWMSQAAIYRNIEWPSGTRYDFPGVLIAYALLIAGIVALLGLVPSESWRRAAEAALLLALLAMGGEGVVHHTMAQAKANSARSKHFATWITSIAALAKSDPSAPILLLPENAASHYEPAISVYRYLRYKKIANPILLSTKLIDAQAHPSSLEANTIQVLNQEMSAGVYPEFKRIDDNAAWPANAVLVFFGEQEKGKVEAGPHRIAPGSFEATLGARLPEATQ